METSKKKSSLISLLASVRIPYVEITNQYVLDCVYKLYIEDTISDCNDSLYYLYFALYQTYFGNHWTAEEYFLLSVKGGNIDALYYLANLYKLHKKFDLAEIYFLKAIDKGCINSMNELSKIYYETGKFYLADKYIAMTINCCGIPATEKDILCIQKENCELTKRSLLKDATNISNDYNYYVITCLLENKFDLGDRYLKEAFRERRQICFYVFSQNISKTRKYGISRKVFFTFI